MAGRFKQHEHGKTRLLKNRGPFDIIRVEEFASKGEAIKRERQIKRYKGGEAFKKLIAFNFGDVA